MLCALQLPWQWDLEVLAVEALDPLFQPHGRVYFASLKGIYTGPESTERFAGGLILIWPENCVFFNFFGHLGPVGRPMEGLVDFDHTNFSRRIHPRHPDFLPGPDVEILTFWG